MLSELSPSQTPLQYPFASPPNDIVIPSLFVVGIGSSVHPISDPIPCTVR